jgi:hypothetical protein
MAMNGYFRTVQLNGKAISVGDFIEWEEDENKSTIGICWQIHEFAEKFWFECLIIASSHYYPENFTPLSSNYSVAGSRILNVYKFQSNHIGYFMGIHYKANT